jgi:hypothetical protein
MIGTHMTRVVLLLLDYRGAILCTPVPLFRNEDSPRGSRYACTAGSLLQAKLEKDSEWSGAGNTVGPPVA